MRHLNSIDFLRSLTRMPQLFFLCTPLLISACSLFEINEQSQIMNSLGEIRGEVDVAIVSDAPVHIALFIMDDGVLDLVDHYPVGDDGKYILPVLPDTYFIAAYVDINNDEVYQSDEPASYIGMAEGEPKKFHLVAGDKIAAEKFTISGRIEHRVAPKKEWSYPKYEENIGRIVTLDDPVFKQENASMGLWRPLDFINNISGGVFFLEEYDEEKIPVLFIHGANGSALNWKKVIGSMDREKFQPWLLYYPSGSRLDMISNYMMEVGITLWNRHKFEQLYIVAHSMGGLVARSFIMKHIESKSRVQIALSITINSPMKGMESAKSGVEYSPIVVPSWRDVAKDSEFIQKVTAWNLPEGIPYHLVFSYQSGEDGDGVVSLESQIPVGLQVEAEKIYGFNSGHASILQDEIFITRFNAILEETFNKNASSR